MATEDSTEKRLHDLIRETDILRDERERVEAFREMAMTRIRRLTPNVDRLDHMLDPLDQARSSLSDAAHQLVKALGVEIRAREQAIAAGRERVAGDIRREAEQRARAAERGTFEDVTEKLSAYQAIRVENQRRCEEAGLPR